MKDKVVARVQVELGSSPYALPGQQHALSQVARIVESVLPEPEHLLVVRRDAPEVVRYQFAKVFIGTAGVLGAVDAFVLHPGIMAAIATMAGLWALKDIREAVAPSLAVLVWLLARRKPHEALAEELKVDFDKSVAAVLNRNTEDGEFAAAVQFLENQEVIERATKDQENPKRTENWIKLKEICVVSVAI